MKNYILGFLLLFSVLAYSQNKIEKATYISTTFGQDLKLNLLDNNQYEFVLFYGNYEVKNDTLHFNNNYSNGPDFGVVFSSDANPSLGKIKVNIKGSSVYYSGIYIGTQSGNAEPDYKIVSDLAGELKFEDEEANFEINKAEYLYLAREDYNGETSIYKYALPRNVNEIKIEYTPNYLAKVKLQGYYNEKNELVVSENKKNPLTFVKGQKPEATEAKVKPIETLSKKNWTFPGKPDIYGYGAADSAAVAAVSNFKLAVQDNLQKALEVTKKTPQKFLVVSYDPDNKNAKTAFDAFIQTQEYNIGSYSSYGQITDYDKYNYYLATAKDKSWAAKNAIMHNPSTIVLDAEGNILSQTNGNLPENAGIFDVYYSSIGEKLKYVKGMVDLNKVLNSKKTNDSEIVKKMLPLSDENLYSWTIEPPTKVAVGFEEPSSVEPVAADTMQGYSDYSENETTYTKVNFDKKKLLSAWDKIVNSHGKDKTPDMDFVKVALAEVQNRGFYYKIFDEQRPFDETSFHAIDYLLKHYDAILEEQKKTSGQGDVANYYGDYTPTIESQLPLAISNSISQIGANTDEKYRNRVMEAYKKVTAKKPQNYTTKLEYLRLLQTIAETQNKENPFVAEYDAFFKEVFKSGKNEIEILDDLYAFQTKIDYSYNDWTSFKSSFSNASNEAAWFVVQKGKDPESIKKAIQWSESSLRIEKNNPYYLDTLAQLYYKNGEKQKAIATQEQALKFSDTMGEDSKADLETVLEKMKNGTY